MDNSQKINAVVSAFEQAVDQYRSENKPEQAEQMANALADVPEASLVRLYDILKNIPS